MQACRLMFADTEIASIHSVEELEEILIHIRKHFNPPNPVLNLFHPNDQVLVLAISGEGCYLDYLDTTEPFTTYSSVGDRTLSRKDGIVEFQMSSEEHITEISPKNIITFEDLLGSTPLKCGRATPG